MRTLSHEEARAFYDRLGARPDTQGFYEGPTTTALVENGSFGEAHRTLEPGGHLCTVCLTHGSTVPARIVGCLWHAFFRLSPKLVGGCRAIRIEDFLDRSRWAVRYREIVTRFGISSEVLVATCRKSPGAGS